MTAGTWLTGPIAITGPSGHVGRTLGRHLAELPNPIRPLDREDDWATAIADADAVIHLAGSLQPRRPSTYWEANVGTVVRCVQAVRHSTVQRVVFLSYVGADPRSGNEYLRTKGQAEKLVRGLRIPSVVFRSTYIYGDGDDVGPSFVGYQTQPGGSVLVLGDGSQKVAPIHVEDLARMLASAALDLSTPTGTFEVSGPDTFTLDEFVHHLNPAGIRIKHIPGPIARTTARLIPRLTPELVEVLVSDSLAGYEPAQSAASFGVSLRSAGRSVVSAE